jgi:Asp-tRNA(Asn)/Glu-tRNA(Gln) amidotransferase A subunit family amidase
MEPCELSLAEAGRLIASRALSPVELLDSCLARIEATEQQVQAWAFLDAEAAREVARERERELLQGRSRGPLHGIPVGIKDIFYTASVPTEAGSVVMRGFVPDEDAAAVAGLKAAGAVPLGKTQTTEFAGPDPGPTRNPWNLDHTPGGSSSGSSAAVAARMCPAALGSQSGGSTLRPAAYCGIVGLKPRHGRISTYGMVPISAVVDHVGILTRSVEDAILVLRPIAGHDVRDPYSLAEPAPRYVLDGGERSRPRLGLATGSFLDKADSELRGQLEDAAERLTEEGAHVERIELPFGLDETQKALETILSVGFAMQHAEIFETRRQDIGTGLQALISTGRTVSGSSYAEAVELRVSLQAAVADALRDVEALLTPATTGAAPEGISSTGDPVMQFPWSLLGFPAISLPTGLSSAGLPLGAQLVAAPQREESLLRAAHWCEQVLDVRLRPPL